MNTQEAISTLQKLKTDKQNKEQFNTTKTFADSLNGLKNILTDVIVGCTKLVLGNRYEVVVKNFPKDNSAIEIKKLSQMIDSHHQEMKREKVMKKEEKKDDTDTKILSTGLTIADTLKSSSTGQMVRLLNLQDTLEQAVKAIKNIKLDPHINVTSPEVKVDAPIVNIPKTDIKFPKTIEVSNLDFTEMVSKLEELLTELQYQGKQSVMVANPGDFPVSLPVPTFRDINGATTQVVLTADGSLPVSVDADNPLAKYRISDRDNSAFPKYYGSVDETGAWYIMKEEANSFRYCAGTTAYSTNWTNRASLVYDYYNSIF